MLSTSLPGSLLFPPGEGEKTSWERGSDGVKYSQDKQIWR